MAAAHRSGAVLAALVVSVLAACAGRYGGAAQRPAGASSPGGPGGTRGLTGSLEAAALPYQIVDARTGKSVDAPAFWSRLATSRAVCIGEEHANPHHHWMQLHIVRELFRRLPKGAQRALAMEMFQRPFQNVLDEYAARRIDAAQLRSRSGYAARWGYDYAFYGPTIDAAVVAGAQLLAANAAKELTKKVVRHGLASLTADEKAQLPELVLDDAQHRAWFDALMEDMGGAEAHTQQRPGDAKAPAQTSAAAGAAPASAAAMPSADQIYVVQVIWDESMADAAARWLAAHPEGHVVLLAGNGHCHDSAVIHRLQRRGVATALSIRGVVEDDEGSVGAALARPINDYLLVLQMPAGVARGSTHGAP